MLLEQHLQQCLILILLITQFVSDIFNTFCFEVVIVVLPRKYQINKLFVFQRSQQHPDFQIFHSCFSMQWESHILDIAYFLPSQSQSHLLTISIRKPFFCLVSQLEP
ncbi:hypothetical protein FGO68_gene1699 [Halteria grandinella]|uniref:Uncharacterized protein n=1 Tax=Halteria grandinella TaxID=5974 RepID=A0A8J8SY12_HALGN|nr:hypothetical protein FGO68_gene1699 [Halteria grandinella]